MTLRGNGTDFVGKPASAAPPRRCRNGPTPEMGGGVAVLHGGGVESARRRSAPAWHTDRNGVHCPAASPNGAVAARGFVFEHGNSRRYLPRDGRPDGCTDEAAEDVRVGLEGPAGR